MKRTMMILAGLAVSLMCLGGEALAVPSLPVRRVIRMPVEPFPGGGSVPAYQLRAGEPRTVVSAEDLELDQAVTVGPGVAKVLEAVGSDPYAAYRWVRDRVEYLPYFGVKAGSEGVAWSLVGNDFDQAALLAALLRSQGYPTRFVYGVVRVEGKVAADWCGMATAEEAYRFLVEGGVPVRAILVSNIPRYLELSHVWLEARVPLTNPGSQGEGEGVWIPLDPSFKRHAVQRGQDLFTQLGFQQENFLLDYLQEPGEGSPEEYFRDLLRGKLAEYGNVTTLGEVALKVSVIPEGDGSLPTGMPPELNVLGVIWEEAHIPEVYHFRIRLTLWDGHDDGAGITPGDLRVTIPSAFFSEHMLAVDYVPATAQDQALAEGSPSGSPLDPAVRGEIRLRPRLLVDGHPITEYFSGDFLESGIPGLELPDAPIPANIGFHQKLLVETLAPAKDPADTLPVNMGAVERELQVGGMYALGCTGGLVSAGRMEAEAEELRRLQTEGTVQEVFAATISVAALQYLHKTALSAHGIAALLGVRYFEDPLLMLCGIHPTGGFDPGGVFYDVTQCVMALVSRDGRADREQAFMFLAGLQGSYYEHKVLSDVFQTTAVSAVRILKQMQSLGMSPLVLDSEDPEFGAKLGALVGLSAEQKAEILERVMGQGWKLIIPPQAATLERWTGWGYIIWDPDTGNGGYMISGGLAGGHFTVQGPTFMVGLWLMKQGTKTFTVVWSRWLDPLDNGEDREDWKYYHFEITYVDVDDLKDGPFIASVMIVPEQYLMRNPDGSFTDDVLTFSGYSTPSEWQYPPVIFETGDTMKFHAVAWMLFQGMESTLTPVSLDRADCNSIIWTLTGKGEVLPTDGNPTVYFLGPPVSDARLEVTVSKKQYDMDHIYKAWAILRKPDYSKPIPVFIDQSGNQHSPDGNGYIYVGIDDLANWSLNTDYTHLRIWDGNTFLGTNLAQISQPGVYSVFFTDHENVVRFIKLWVIKIDIEAYRPGTMSAPGMVVTETDEDDPLKLVAAVNDDNDGMGPEGQKDNRDDWIDVRDDDIVTVHLKKFQPVGVTTGTLQLTITPPSAIQVIKGSSSGLLADYSIDLANPDPQEDLAGLVIGDSGVTLFLEGMAPNQDVVVTLAYKDTGGTEIVNDEFHFCIPGVTRIPLGGTANLDKFTIGKVYVPTMWGGDLELSGDNVDLFYTDGSNLYGGTAADVFAGKLDGSRLSQGNPCVYEVPENRHGWYYVRIVSDTSVEISAKFVQRGSASTIPWNGWYWPTLDSIDPNLYDASGSYTPLKDYDAVYGTYERTAEEVNYSGGEGWWGHCWGWSLAAIAASQPAPTSKNGIVFNEDEMEGFYIELGDGATTGWTWRVGSPDPNPGYPPTTEIPPGPPTTAMGEDVDSWAGKVQNALCEYVRRQRKAMNGDLRHVTGGNIDAVWNHDIFRYESMMKEASGNNERIIEVTTKINSSDDLRIPSNTADFREDTYVYVLEYRNDGTIDETSALQNWLSTSGFAPSCLGTVEGPLNWQGNHCAITKARVDGLYSP